MQPKTLRAALAAALLSALATTAAWADVKDYEFQLVDKAGEAGRGRHRGQARPQTFRPRHSRRGDFRQAHRHGARSDGSDDGSLGGGVIDRAGRLPLQDQFEDGGPWALSLGAKVQGETGTVESKLIVKVAP